MCIVNLPNANIKIQAETKKTPVETKIETKTTDNKLETSKDSFKSSKKETTFIDDNKVFDVMVNSAKKSSSKITEKVNEIASIMPFVEGNNEGNVKADLNINIIDKNGFLDYGEQDLEVTLNGDITINQDVFFKSLKENLENKEVLSSFKADAKIGSVSFDKEDKSYKIQLKVDGLLFFNDDMNLVLKPDSDGNLVLKVEDKWLPNLLQSDDDILSKVQNKIAKELKKIDFGLETTIRDNKLYFLPKIENKTIKLNEKDSLRIDKTNLDFSKAKFDIDSKGAIKINLRALTITGSNLGKNEKKEPIPTKTSGDVDFANLQVSANIDTKGNKEIAIKNGVISTSLDEKESERIQVEGSNLGAHFNTIGITADNIRGKVVVNKDSKMETVLNNDLDIKMERPNKKIGIKGNFSTAVNSKGEFSIESKGIAVSHPNGKSTIKELNVQNTIKDGKDNLKVTIEAEEITSNPVRAKVTKNDLKLLVDSDNYKKELFNSLDKAKESIHIESFLYSGNIAKEVTQKLLIKSAGLTKDKLGNFKIDNPNGVKVKAIFDSSMGDKNKDNHPSMILVKEEYNKFLKEITEGKGAFSTLKPEEKQKVISNLEKNMKWKMLEGGITKIDHRKEIIIDGSHAFSGGGINLTDSAMRKHDMMVKVYGPAVGQIQKEFLENWEEVAGKVPEEEKKKLLKDEKTLTQIMKKHQFETGSTHTSKTQVLVTDDNQNDTDQKLVENIRKAKKINIEHAYFTDKKIVTELAEAIKRGAEVNVIIPEYSDEDDKLHYGNLGTLQILKKASEESGSGKFNAYLFKWNPKESTGKFTHTKAVSFDDKVAIIGSTNLTTRSMRGTAQGFLFNKEMSLLVDDDKFVKDLNKNIFAKDMKPEFSKKLDDKWFKDLTKEQAKIDKYTSLQPLF